MTLRLCCLMIAFAAFSQNHPQHSNTLTWKYSEVGGYPAAGFHIQRSLTPGGPYAIIATIPSPPVSTTYIDTGVKPGETNYYVVTAFNAKGESAPSNEISLSTPLQVPNSPMSLAGTAK
jgi:hypothetical protein